MNLEGTEPNCNIELHQISTKNMLRSIIINNKQLNEKYTFITRLFFKSSITLYIAQSFTI